METTQSMWIFGTLHGLFIETIQVVGLWHTGVILTWKRPLSQGIGVSLHSISPEETLPLRQAILRPGLPIEASRYDGDELAMAGHFGVFEGQVLLAVGSVLPEICRDPNGDTSMSSAGAWRLRGMATLPQARGRGCGSEIVRACLQHARDQGGSVVWCNARTGATEFYLRHGFIQMSGSTYCRGLVRII